MSRQRIGRIKQMPKHLRDLGYPIEAYRLAVVFFRKRGIDFGFSRIRREWFFAAWKIGEPTRLYLWCGPGAVVDHLDAPSGLIQQFKELGAEVT